MFSRSRIPNHWRAAVCFPVMEHYFPDIPTFKKNLDASEVLNTRAQ